MRPKTLKSELPTRSTVRNHITTSYLDAFESIHAAISSAPGSVSVIWDMWTAPYTSDPYLGMLATWIDVSSTGEWTMRDEVIAFHRIFGDHGGKNLGRYFTLLLDRCKITSKKCNKVSVYNILQSTGSFYLVSLVKLRMITPQTTRPHAKKSLAAFKSEVYLGTGMSVHGNSGTYRVIDYTLMHRL